MYCNKGKASRFYCAGDQRKYSNNSHMQLLLGLNNITVIMTVIESNKEWLKVVIYIHIHIHTDNYPW